MFAITDAEIAKVRAIYSKTEDDIQCDVDIIVAWLEKQAHLPKEHDRKRIERFLLRNKFQLQLTKQKIDAYFCARLWYGDFFSDLDPLSERMKRMKDMFYWVPLPKLTPSMERVIVYKVGKNSDIYDHMDYMAFMMLIIDLQLSHDYANSERFVYDMDGYNSKHFKTMDISSMSKWTGLYLNCLSGRLSGVDIINPKPLFSTMMSMFKLCMPADIIERFIVHTNIESFYEVVPKEILPVDFGGDERSLNELQEDTWKIIHEQRDFILKQANMVSNERLRMNSEFSNGMFGADGSFKNININ